MKVTKKLQVQKIFNKFWKDHRKGLSEDGEVEDSLEDK